MSNRDSSEHGDSSNKIASNECNEANKLGFNFTQLWLQITTTYSLIDRNDSNIFSGDERVESGQEKTSVVILGKKYDDISMDDGVIEQDIYSKIWLTYRTGFEPIAKCLDGPQPLSFVQSMVFNRNPISSTFNNFHGLLDNDNFTTDVGWGCMIRTSQALLANTYQLLLLGRGFSYDRDRSPRHDEIIDMFMDEPRAPFSLHNFIKVASELPLKVKPGQWFGPNAASLSIKRLCDNVYESNGTERVKVLISESSNLYDDIITQMFTTLNPVPDAILVLLPVRLGIDKVNPLYHASVLQLLALRQSVGIAGGKPSSSFYFFGYEGNDLLYLDPHYPQFVRNKTSIYDTYHTNLYQKLSVDDMDPSMMVGILIKDINDYEDFKRSCTKSSNKILHFHPTSEKADRRGSLSEFKRKNSEFVCIESKDVQKGEDFITIDNLSRDDLNNMEGFIDMADEFDSEIDQNNKDDNFDDDEPVNVSQTSIGAEYTSTAGSRP